MKFRLLARVAPTGSHVYVHLRALVIRAGVWEVCGVFQLLTGEWAPFSAFCKEHGIEVEFEAPVPPYASRPSKLSENDVERACIDVLHIRGYWVARLHAGTFKSADGKRWIQGVKKGTPDYALLHERFPGFLLEVKRTDASPTPEQINKHREIQMGFRLAIATVDSVEALAHWLAQHEAKATALWHAREA